MKKRQGFAAARKAGTHDAGLYQKKQTGDMVD